MFFETLKVVKKKTLTKSLNNRANKEYTRMLIKKATVLIAF